MASALGPDIVAAGAIVLRPDRGGEVLLVHRPRYDDWSFPKGKCDAGETFEATAAREVAEETGLQVTFGPPLPEARYRDHKDRPKLVRYWAMEVAGGAFVPNDEVDAVAWLAVDAAADQLTYSHDVALLHGLLRVT